MSIVERDISSPDEKVLIIGGGPAGLTAAYELLKRDSGYRPVAFEASEMVGGISRTEMSNGNRFDIGGHRFFTKVPDVEAMWHEVLGDDFITVPRQSRIYYKGRYFSYPLKAFDALAKIGPYESLRIIASYLKWQIRPNRREASFEEWVINRFGGRLYMHFFRTYTRKVWGIDPAEIRSDWAAQRIKDLSLWRAVWNSLTGGAKSTSLIEEFQYPRLGPGMMWEKARDRINASDGEVRMRSEVTRVHRDGRRVTGIDVRRWTPDGAPPTMEHHTGAHVINSMALRDLIHAFDPPPPPEVVAAADRLRYRDFLIVTLNLKAEAPFPDNWIYIHSPEVRVARIQNFGAWSKAMLADPDHASIGMEYFCNIDDDLWSMPDDTLKDLAASELERLGLGRARDVIGAAIIRQPKAYPVYDTQYQDALETVSDWLRTLENFQTVGRNGLHRYNNQDHSMLSAMYAARNIMGGCYDVWNVNVERSYHEEFQLDRTKDAQIQAAE